MSRSAKVAKSAASPSERCPELAWIAQGVHGEERRECVKVLAKSIMTGDYQEILDAATAEFRATRRALQVEDKWELAQEFYRLNQSQRPQAQNNQASGSMTDAAKRLREDPEAVSEQDDEFDKWLHVHAKDTPPGSDLYSPGDSDLLRSPLSDGGPHGPGDNEAPRGPPPPTPHRLYVAATERNYPFPPGITTMDQWSETIIDFGKFKDMNKTYGDLARDGSPVAVGYIKWLIPRQESLSGQCKDLANYMCRRQREGRLPNVPAPGATVIPGTCQSRRLRSASSNSSSA